MLYQSVPLRVCVKTPGTTDSLTVLGYPNNVLIASRLARERPNALKKPVFGELPISAQAFALTLSPTCGE